MWIDQYERKRNKNSEIHKPTDKLQNKHSQTEKNKCKMTRNKFKIFENKDVEAWKIQDVELQDGSEDNNHQAIKGKNTKQ